MHIAHLAILPPTENLPHRHRRAQHTDASYVCSQHFVPVWEHGQGLFDVIPKLRRLEQESQRAAAIARNGREFACNVLTREGRADFWGALLRGLGRMRKYEMDQSLLSRRLRCDSYGSSVPGSTSSGRGGAQIPPLNLNGSCYAYELTPGARGDQVRGATDGFLSCLKRWEEGEGEEETRRKWRAQEERCRRAMEGLKYRSQLEAVRQSADCDPRRFDT